MRRLRPRCPQIVEAPGRARRERADRRRLPLQRPPPADQISRVRPRARQVPHQSRQRRRQASTTSNFRAIIEVAVRNEKPVRIGVNWGSLDQILLTEMMDDNAAQRRAARRARCHDRGDGRERAALRRLAEQYRPAARHGSSSAPRSAACRTWSTSIAARGPLRLPAAPRTDRSRHGQQGHGGHHRGALDAAAGGHRRHDPRLAHARCRTAIAPKKCMSPSRSCSRWGCALHPAGHRCPGCGRTTSTFFQQMADRHPDYLREQMPLWREAHPGVEEMRVAVMGCVVNGPGESKHANIGISLPGTFEEPKAPVYVDGTPASRRSRATTSCPSFSRSSSSTSRVGTASAAIELRLGERCGGGLQARHPGPFPGREHGAAGRQFGAKVRNPISTTMSA